MTEYNCIDWCFEYELCIKKQCAARLYFSKDA